MSQEMRGVMAAKAALLSMSAGQTQDLSARYSLRTPFDIQLDEDVLYVRLHSLGTDGEVPGNFLVGQTFGDQSEYVAFARAQRLGNCRRRDLLRPGFITRCPGCI